MNDIEKLLDRITRVETRMDNQVRHGKVTDVDTKKQLCRIEIGERNGKPVKSPWVPYAQFAGDYKSHTPPTKGQQLSIFAPNGEFRQAVVMPFTWTNQNKSPSDKEDEHVHTYGKDYRIREKQDRRETTVGKVKITQTKDAVTFSVSDKNQPKDDNGVKADENAEDDQTGGSWIRFEKDKITLRRGDATLTIEPAKIAAKLGSSEVELTSQGLALVGSTIVLAGETYIGMENKSDKDGQKIMTEAGPALNAKAKA